MMQRMKVMGLMTDEGLGWPVHPVRKPRCTHCNPLNNLHFPPPLVCSAFFKCQYISTRNQLMRALVAIYSTICISPHH